MATNAHTIYYLKDYMVSTFTREIIINSDLIFLSPQNFSLFNHSYINEFAETSDIDCSYDHIINSINETLVKLIHVDIFTFIVAGDDVLKWNHREIILDQFYRQIFYPYSTRDTYQLDQSNTLDAIDVCYKIVLKGTEMLMPGEINVLETALEKFTGLVNRINLSTQFVNFKYQIIFTTQRKKSSDEIVNVNDSNYLPLVVDGNISTNDNKICHLNTHSDISKRLSEIIIPFLLLPQLDNLVGIYHRAPRILLYGDTNRKSLESWLQTIRNHLKFKYLPISISHVFSCYCGNSEKNLTFAFDLAKLEGSFPTILLFDGIHLICTNDSSDDLTNRLLTTFILQLDQLNHPFESNYLRAQIVDAAIKCSNDCPIAQWIDHCKPHLDASFSGKIQGKAYPIAIIAISDVPIDRLSQAVARKGRFDYLFG